MFIGQAGLVRDLADPLVGLELIPVIKILNNPDDIGIF